MQVAYKHDEPSEVYFIDVPFGGVFLKNGEAWMKTHLHAEEADEDSSEFNAIRLEDAEIYEFGSSEWVILPKSAELVIEW